MSNTLLTFVPLLSSTLWRRQKFEEKTNGGSRYGRIRRKNWNEARVEHKLGHNNSCGSPRLIICLKELWLLANSKAPRFSGVRTWKQKKNRTSFLPFGEKKKKKRFCAGTMGALCETPVVSRIPCLSLPCFERVMGFMDLDILSTRSFFIQFRYVLKIICYLMMDSHFHLENLDIFSLWKNDFFVFFYFYFFLHFNSVASELPNGH